MSRISAVECPLFDKTAVRMVTLCSLTRRCTRHLTQPALRCRSRRSASSAS